MNFLGSTVKGSCKGFFQGAYRAMYGLSWAKIDSSLGFEVIQGFLYGPFVWPNYVLYVEAMGPCSDSGLEWCENGLRRFPN